MFIRSKRFGKLSALLAFVGLAVLLSSFFSRPAYKASFKFPYRKAGLTAQQAAAQLLSRFTYGATPGQIDAVVHQGLEKWFQQQLDGTLPDDSLNQLLSSYDALRMSNTQIAATFPKPGELLRLAVKDGAVNKDSVKSAGRKAYRDTLQQYMQQKGYKPEQELIRQFVNQKVLRAAYSNNQLREVMTDFWFNHFNVSFTKNDCAQFIPDYERDVIRPNALGYFDTLLLATAKSPAMLYYLDNFNSAAPAPKLQMNDAVIRNAMAASLQTNADLQRTAFTKLKQARSNQGINENYAREVMELHTLGVDGGYTQQDVTQAARVLTGWTVYPMGPNAALGQNIINRFTPEQLAKRGFVYDENFLFNANRHDKGTKTVLGHTFGPDGGYQEGVDLLNLLAHQAATARFISRKIGVRFVSDNPPQSLIDQMARTFMEQDGDIKQVLITMACSPEFWSNASLREKTKSPFELAISTVRSLNAGISQPFQLYNWVAKMGEKKYYYIAPTGFPDKGQFWINTGSLLTRMNFGLALAANRIPGVKVDLPALNQHHEPESAQQALMIYSQLMLPQRNLDATVKRLTPLLTDPELATKVDAASTQQSPAGNVMQANSSAPVPTAGNTVPAGKGGKRFMARQTPGGDNSMLAQVVGVIIGSPEYQRR